ncbi:MAG: DJ-1/PfpI family protein [Ruminococcaceae bacterium]|nr:DJ-1/PfpI family protein [Oscillospiraceae bacterium]
MIYVFLANGFEECEALAPIDILRRAGFDVITVGVNGKTAVGAHNIPVICDITIDEASFNDIEAIILPGGMPGTINLENDKTVQAAIDFASKNGLLIGAICAAPSILGHNNLLKHKKATCFPGFEKDLLGAEYIDTAVVRDGNIITAKGAGVAFQFGFELLAYLKDEKTANDLKIQMMFK